MPRGSTTERGYGYTHRQVRAAELPYAYGLPCLFCGEIMRPGQQLHLDHTPDRRGYRGFAHASCNRLDGAKRGGKRTRGRRRAWTTTRSW